MTSATEFLDSCKSLIDAPQVHRSGFVTRVSGLVFQAEGLDCPLGTVIEVEQSRGPSIEAEVVGFEDSSTFLMPFSPAISVRPGAKARVKNSGSTKPSYLRYIEGKERHYTQTLKIGKELPVGDELLGRVVDPNGTPLDHFGSLASPVTRSLHSEPLNPLDREPIREPLDVGVRAINALLTVGKGQRLGIFAGSGVGKSVLLGMMAKYTKATRIVVGLIGERGREVKEFIEEILGEEGLARSVVVAAPADSSPLLRLQGASYSTSIAEEFRDQGHDVLLIMDSLTRYAMAQREIALAIGEPPATKGYPPSVFAKLPALVERAGNAGKGCGSITAFYTVLTEGDDQQDPIADSARAILDGHIVLSRKLAESGHYPAIDISQSISRVMHNIVGDGHLDASRELKAAFSKIQENRDLIAIGAYSPGSDQMLDLAISMYPAMESLLVQKINESCSYEISVKSLEHIFPQPFAFERERKIQEQKKEALSEIPREDISLAQAQAQMNSRIKSRQLS